VGFSGSPQAPAEAAARARHEACARKLIFTAHLSVQGSGRKAARSPLRSRSSRSCN
jgi:hypothetical protein